jgi:hypothetical protein
VVEVPNGDGAARRARWLAELSVALDEAGHLIEEFGTGERRFEAVELHARIEAAKLEVEAMRLRRANGGAGGFGPEWSKDLPWIRRA